MRVAYLHDVDASHTRAVEIQTAAQLLSLPGVVSPDGCSPDMNDFGTAVSIQYVDNAWKVVIGNGVSSPTYIDGSLYEGGFHSGYSLGGGELGCAINNQGVVAFMAIPEQEWPFNGPSGIFTGPNPATDKVIMMGDILDGATVNQVLFSRGGLNNKGQIAFNATLSDGTQGVWVATPVPEPSTLVLFGAGAISLLGYVWRRRRQTV